MRIAFYLNSISPHQLPLAREVATFLGEDNVLYIFQFDVPEGRLKCGWMNIRERAGIRLSHIDADDSREWLENSNVVYSGVRDFALFARRASKGLQTFYASERWFKPIQLGRWLLPGFLRLISPSYLKMLISFSRWRHYDLKAKCLAIGPKAAQDFRLIGVHRSNIVPWGYYVDTDIAASAEQSQNQQVPGKLRILWVGRMVALKRVDTLIKALKLLVNNQVSSPFEYSLTLVGDGPELCRLQRLAEGLPVSFLPFQPLDVVRGIMRNHDIFVFPSNGLEGWGAVVNEALSEGMVVLGAAAPGACLSLLPKGRLFRVGDYRHLAKLLSVECKPEGLPEQWTPSGAAMTLVKLAEEVV